MTTNNKVETNGTYTETEQKVFEIMEHLIGNLTPSYIKPEPGTDFELITMGRNNNRIDFIMEKDGKEYFPRVNDEEWTLVELFVRQYLNNGIDGFGMFNVEECFDYIMDNIDFIIEQDMISETGWNSSGQELWSNYRPEDVDLGFNYYIGE